ncbi:MAG: sulfotransferase [Steroidobacteraceae bacterium]|nr:sulfotransferase [Steroidobacteraceae bacterium]MBP7012593.1 sulfotransferase [Steroidobacteraceae bacterium]
MTLDLDALLSEARVRAGGLTDFGDARFRPAAGALLAAMNSEGGLSQAGVYIWRKRVIEMLRNRLVMEDYYRRHPEIEQEEIGGPIVIVGLPRTGTTLLQRVLGCDRRFYPMLTWESRYPTPMVEPGTAGADPRIAVVKAETDAMLKANPTLLAIHPLSATEPDEEGMLMEHSFQSFFDAYVDIPSYTEWMWNHDQTMAYEYLQRMLRFIQWQKRKRGIEAGDWVLKTPHHLRQMDVLFKVFPGTRVIQTHRDPLQTIPSIASFTFNLWKVYMEQPDPMRAGRQWSAIFARGVRESMRFRDSSSPARFCDVWFADTLAKPLEVVRSIYDYLGISFPADTQTSMQAYLEANRREKRPLHEYALGHYGLSEEQIRQDFAVYRERYILPRGD